MSLDNKLIRTPISQEAIDRISFIGKIIDDLYKKINEHQKEYDLEGDNLERKNAIKDQQDALRKTIREYKTEQEVITFYEL